MRFEIPFNERISRKQSKLLFDLHWEVLLKKNNKLIYYIVSYILLGTLVVYGENNIGFIFIVLGLFFLVNFINFRRHYIKNKQAYFKIIDDNINRDIIYNTTYVWQFVEDWFCYSDSKFDLKIKWEVLKKLKVVDETMILEIKDNIISNFIIDKEEVGNQNFQEIINFIELKVKNNGAL